MKKSVFLIVFSALFCCVLLLTGCGKGNTRNTRRLRVATEASFPPYEFYQKGKIVGIDIEILSGIAKKLGLELEVMDMQFDSVLSAVQNGDADVAASAITITSERRKQVCFTRPYLVANQMVVVQKKSGIKQAKTLKAKKYRIGVQQGTTSDSHVVKRLQEPRRYDSWELAAAALAIGQLDAIVCDSGAAEVFVARYPALTVLPEPLDTEKYAFALNKDNTELLWKINAELSRMEKDGRLKAILEKYQKKE